MLLELVLVLLLFAVAALVVNDRSERRAAQASSRRAAADWLTLVWARMMVVNARAAVTEERVVWRASVNVADVMVRIDCDWSIGRGWRSGAVADGRTGRQRAAGRAVRLARGQREDEMEGLQARESIGLSIKHV